ncbi:vacuolar ATP synthase subunit B family protein [Hibiscus syriacus]|uniref:Vacuolar ATP synthase subunit B family protein n=1 Tax=Hibiscus syriacus TaxID=106335 RepID=A0A6A2XBE3_HIBSY|nr:vacuolar ATP synthase subunit B family protein [Hibiscus syriacus]
MLAMSKWFTLTPFMSSRYNKRVGFFGRADSIRVHADGGGDNNNSKSNDERKKVVVVGSGWAGLGAAHHLCNQGFEVTVLDGGDGIGSPDNIGIQGFWYPYKNIFSLVDELGIKPFTSWTRSAQYSAEGLEIQDNRAGRISSIPGTPTIANSIRNLIPHTIIDFDNTDVAWKKYDSSKDSLSVVDSSIEDIFSPLLQVGLFAPAEQCSAAATLGLLYYLVLAHQKHFDVVFCRGSTTEKIFEPWVESLKAKGCEILEGKRVTDFKVNEETGCITEVVSGKETYTADAAILTVGIATLQETIKNSAALCKQEEFRKILNLAGIDLVTVKLRLDRKVRAQNFPWFRTEYHDSNLVLIPNPSNACAGFDDLFGCTFFDLTAIHDEHKGDTETILQADFYHANELLPLKDDLVIEKVMPYLSKCINGLERANVVDKEIRRFVVPNLFMAGDWIITRHGSWSQEKSYVTGLEAANRVVDYLEEGSFARVIPVEEDEPHIEALRNLNRRVNEIISQVPLSGYFLQ